MIAADARWQGGASAGPGWGSPRLSLLPAPLSVGEGERAEPVGPISCARVQLVRPSGCKHPPECDVVVRERGPSVFGLASARATVAARAGPTTVPLSPAQAGLESQGARASFASSAYWRALLHFLTSVTVDRRRGRLVQVGQVVGHARALSAGHPRATSPSCSGLSPSQCSLAEASLSSSRRHTLAPRRARTRSSSPSRRHTLAPRGARTRSSSLQAAQPRRARRARRRVAPLFLG